MRFQALAWIPTQFIAGIARRPIVMKTSTLFSCPVRGDAWSPAGVQSERQPETACGRYKQCGDMFYNGKAPGPGESALGFRPC
jgi:hypothetical protein